MDNLEDSSESLQLYFEQAIADGDVEAVRKLVTLSSHDLNSGDGRVNATALFLLSVQGGNVDIIESVLQLRPPPNMHFNDDKDRRLLHFDAETGSLSVVKTLLSLDDSVVNVHVNMSDVDGRTPIMIAASKGYANIVEFLIQKDGRLNEVRLIATGDSILHLAAQEGHLGVVEVLIKHGADVNCRTPSEDMWTPKGGRTVLHSAVLGGNTEVVKLLCANGADQSITDDCGLCPFHMAAHRGHIDMVQTFIDIGADINCQTRAACGGMTVLHYAVLGGNTEIVKLLCANGADQSRTDDLEQCPLHLAAYEGHVDMVRNFIDIGEILEMRDIDSMTPLTQAVLGQAEEVVAYLLKCGADVAAVDESGFQSIHHATDDGRVDIVQMLIEHGADVDAKASETTPLMKACSAGNPSVVEHLIAHGADVNKVDADGHTALHCAQMFGEDGQIKEEPSLQLIAAGAKISVRDKRGKTPLDECCLNCIEAVNVIKILVRFGAELTPDASQPSSDEFPTSALLSLILNGFYESARFLVLAGWDVRKEKWLKIRQENWLNFWQNQWQDDSLQDRQDQWQDQWQDEWMYSKRQEWLNGLVESPEHHDFVAWLRSQITEPKSLTWLGRDSIRRTLIQVSDGKEILSKVAQLPVPPRVISFLNLEDI